MMIIMMMMVMMRRRVSHTERWSCFPEVKSLVSKVLLKILPVPNNQASWSNTMIIIIISVGRLLLGWPLFKWL